MNMLKSKKYKQPSDRQYNNSAKLPKGIYKYHYKQNNKILECYSARLNIGGYHPLSKSFSVSKYGKKKALELAIQAREDFLNLPEVIEIVSKNPYYETLLLGSQKARNIKRYGLEKKKPVKTNFDFEPMEKLVIPTSTI